MKKEVVISIRGEQNFENLEQDETELVTQGVLYEKDGSYFLVYEESELTGMPDTKTIVRINKSGVNVLRTGKYPSNMLFEVGKQNISIYNTPYGALTVTVNTEKIESQLSMVSDGYVNVLYSLELDHNHIGKNNLKINVKEI